MTTKGNYLHNLLVINTLSNLSTINKMEANVSVSDPYAFLSIQGRINFLQLERYGKYSEQRHRQQFEKTFDFYPLTKNGSGRGESVIMYS